MILGVFQDGYPRAALTLRGADGSLDVEFIIDTGFDGQLCLSGRLARQLGVQPFAFRDRMLANGAVIRCPVIEVVVGRDSESSRAEVLVLEGNPLIGNEFLSDHLLQIEVTEGGEVTAEPL